jgi:ketosteroid isomerase-like protein
MKLLVIVLTTLCFGCTSLRHDASRDGETLAATSDAIRSAFSRGDIPAILSYHHPDVVKALSYSKVIVGREALRADLTDTLQQVTLQWTENKVESLLINGDTAVEQTTFTIRGTPKNGGKEFIFKGRAQIIYVRYKDSPTGWASIRELVQPAS